MLSYRSAFGCSSSLLIISINVLISCLEISGHIRAQGVHNHFMNTHDGLDDSTIELAPLSRNGNQHGLQTGQDCMSAMVASMSSSSDASPAIEYDRSSSSSSPSERLTKGFEWQMKLDQANRYRLDWTVEYQANRVKFALSINLTTSNFREGSDIFAIGFSNYGQLNSSDFCLAWYDLSHRIHLQDAQTDASHRIELVDESQSVCKLLESSSSFASSILAINSASRLHVNGGNKHHNDLLELVFERPLDVCNTRLPYYTIDNGTTHLVWFTVRGPLLSIDGLNLKELMDNSIKQNSFHTNKEFEESSSSSSFQKPSRSNEGLPGRKQFEFGMKRVQLIASRATKEEKKESKISHSRNLSLDVRMNQFKIPAKETTYWCKLFKLPHKFATRRYHITKFEAVIEKGNEHVVHHMEMFHCANLNTKQEAALNSLYGNEKGGWMGDCNGPTRPAATGPCRRVILAWAMGAHPLEYPEQVGQSIGGHDYSPYVVLEVHYNNVGSNSGLVDSSGLRFHYTSKLRPYDAGILEIGLEYTDKMSIPPNLIAPIAGHCSSECTRVAMAGNGGGDSSKSYEGQLGGDDQSQTMMTTTTLVTTDSKVEGDHYHSPPPSHHHDHHQNVREYGIYIFAAQMHTHLVGVASWTEHVRGGKIIGELQRDNHYSPHFQEIRLLPKPVHVAPGDSLIHYCLYDTTNRVNITLGGFATSDEMCISYLHYYPRLDLEVCKSSVDSRALEAYFGYLAKEEGQKTSAKLSELHPESNDGGDGNNIKSVSENYKSIEWSRRRSEELIQFYSNAPLSIQCNLSNGARLPGYWTGVAPIRLWANNVQEDGGEDAIKVATPFELKLASGRQLVAYRGHEYGRRHAQCARTSVMSIEANGN